MDLISGFNAVLLPVVAGLLLEELTFGGLVRLLLAPLPRTSKCAVRNAGKLTAARGRGEPNRNELGGAKCSH